MDNVSQIIHMLMVTLKRNNRRVDAVEARGRVQGLAEKDAMEVRRLSDHSERLMMIAKALHDAEERNIRGIWGGSK